MAVREHAAVAVDAAVETPDAYAAGMGYAARRALQALTFDKIDGLVLRAIDPVERGAAHQTKCRQHHLKSCLCNALLDRPARSVLGLGLFALSPVPSGQLFVAAGLMRVPLLPLRAVSLHAACSSPRSC